MTDDISTINRELREMHDLFLKVVQIIPSFDITNRKILPYGLKPHTRSVSWIVEQVVVQQTKYNRSRLGVKDVDLDLPDTSLHDCILYMKNGERFYVNIKITSAGRRQNRNDISAVEKLYMQYKANPSYRLVFCIFQFSFSNTTITFVRDQIHTFSPQFLPVYVNPRNDKIQAFYYSDPIERTREDFLRLLQQESKSITLE